MIPEGIEQCSESEEEEDKTEGSKGKTRAARKKVDRACIESELQLSESEEEYEGLMDDMEEEELEPEEANESKKKKDPVKQIKKGRNRAQDADLGDQEEETVFIDNLPSNEMDIRVMLKEVKKHIKILERQFFEEEDSDLEEEQKAKMSRNIDENNEALVEQHHNYIKQLWCIPLSINVKGYDFENFANVQLKNAGRMFDVITIDPPWQLSSANPTRGVAIAYDTLSDKEILSMPFNLLQTDGFIFIWVINAKYRFALDFLDHFGYK